MTASTYAHGRARRSIPASVIVLTAVAAGNAFLAGAGIAPAIVVGLSLLGPVLTLWMVVDVLKSPAPPMRTLDDAEWGYQDRPDLMPHATRRIEVPDAAVSVENARARDDRVGQESFTSRA